MYKTIVSLLSLLLYTQALSSDITLDSQIERIKNASPQERVQLMNQFKIQLQAMNSSKRIEAIKALQATQNLTEVITPNVSSVVQNDIYQNDIKQTQVSVSVINKDNITNTMPTVNQPVVDVPAVQAPIVETAPVEQIPVVQTPVVEPTYDQTTIEQPAIEQHISDTQNIVQDTNTDTQTTTVGRY